MRDFFFNLDRTFNINIICIYKRFYKISKISMYVVMIGVFWFFMVKIFFFSFLR